VRIGTMLVVAVALLVAVGVTFAGGGVAKAAGKGKSVDGGKKGGVVTGAKEGAEAVGMTFAVTGGNKIVEGDAAKTLADVKEGQHVAVVYTTADDKMTATMIHIMVPKKREAPKTE
jgi:hypothetical protein